MDLFGILFVEYKRLRSVFEQPGRNACAALLHAEGHQHKSNKIHILSIGI